MERITFNLLPDDKIQESDNMTLALNIKLTAKLINKLMQYRFDLEAEFYGRDLKPGEVPEDYLNYDLFGKLLENEQLRNNKIKK